MPIYKTPWAHDFHSIRDVIRQQSLRRLGDAPARSMEHLAQRLAERIVPPEPVGQETQSQKSLPLFAMTAPSGASSVPKTQLNRKAIIVARKMPYGEERRVGG
jgi:hypothetical protein